MYINPTGTLLESSRCMKDLFSVASLANWERGTLFISIFMISCVLLSLFKQKFVLSSFTFLRYNRFSRFVRDDHCAPLWQTIDYNANDACQVDGSAARPIKCYDSVSCVQSWSHHHMRNQTHFVRNSGKEFECDWSCSVIFIGAQFFITFISHSQMNEFISIFLCSLRMED